MSAVVRLEWDRDSRGYDIVEGPQPVIDPTDGPGSMMEGTLFEGCLSDGVWIKARGGEPLRYVLEGLENRVFQDVANTPQTPEGALELINKWGVLSRSGVPEVSSIYAFINDIRTALELVERGDLSRLEQKIAGRRIHPLEVRFGRMLGDSAPRVFVEPRSLFHFCWLELMQAIVGEVKIQSCLNCGVYFSIGLQKGTRSTRQYCSDRCRLAMHRKRKRSP